jgi:hypothetical protein
MKTPRTDAAPTYPNERDGNHYETANVARPDITLDRRQYKWDATESAYLGSEGSCGTYGAALDDGKWIPAWMPTDSCDIQCADERFDDPESAITRSHSYFS